MKDLIFFFFFLSLILHHRLWLLAVVFLWGFYCNVTTIYLHINLTTWLSTWIGGGFSVGYFFEFRSSAFESGAEPTVLLTGL